MVTVDHDLLYKVESVMRGQMNPKEEIEKTIETLEAFYFFTQGVKDEAAQHLERLRELLSRLGPSDYPRLLSEIEVDITGIRAHYGAMAADEFYRNLMRDVRTNDGKGFVYISKLPIIRSIFSRYDNSIVRWPHIKLHAFVAFEPKTGFINTMFEIDEQFFHDAQFMLYKARQAQGDAKTQRELSHRRHRALHSILRTVVTTLLTFMEAYLNGIAFDCFHMHHEEMELDDHDFLGEWNSTKNQRRFVRFDDKVFGYPRVIAKLNGRPPIDLSAFKPAHRIVNDAKDLRDAITHPSAQYDPGYLSQKKMALLAGLNLADMESLYNDVLKYVQYVEDVIGYDAKESVPWLFDESGFRDARAETI